MAKYRVIIDKSACIGAGNCVTANKATFKLGSDGKATAMRAEFDDADLAKNKLATKGCPTGAIKIIEIATNKEIKP